MSGVDELFATMGENKNDYAGVSQNQNLSKFLQRESEKLMFSCKCTKLKKKLFGTSRQDRILVLTDKALYNFRPSDKMKSYRWRLKMQQLSGLVVSRESDEVAVQTLMEKEGYRFQIESCLFAFVEACAKSFKAHESETLQIDVTEERDLGKYVNSNNSMPVQKSSSSSTSTAAQSPNAQSRTRSGTQNVGFGGKVITKDACTFHSDAIEGNGRQGWLTKRKGDKELWDPKYVVLEDDALRYFSPKKKGSFELKGCRAMARAQALTITSGTFALPVITEMEKKRSLDESATSISENEQKSKNNQIWPFYITTPSRRSTVEVAASSYKDLQRWIATFAARCQPAAEHEGYVDGWLWKKNPYDKSKTNWRSRYFIVHNTTCTYYEMVEKGSLNIAEGISCASTQIIKSTQRELVAGIPSATNFAFQFTVNDAGRQYPFAADSKEDMEKWMEAIENMNNKNRSKRSSINGGFIASLEEKAPQKNVTIVFTGVQGISNLWNSVSGDVMGDSIEIHDGILRGLLRKFRGYEVKTEGATFMVAFFTPWEALAWCLAVQEALAVANWPEELLKTSETAQVKENGEMIFAGLRVYMGMQVGEPQPKRAPTTGRWDYYGPCVNKSSRVAHAANGGQILITDDILKGVDNEVKKFAKKAEGDSAKESKESSCVLEGKHFVKKDVGKHSLKGIAQPVQMYEILPFKLRSRSATFGHLHTPANEAKEKKKKTVITDVGVRDTDSAGASAAVSRRSTETQMADAANKGDAKSTGRIDRAQSTDPPPPAIDPPPPSSMPPATALSSTYSSGVAPLPPVTDDSDPQSEASEGKELSLQSERKESIQSKHKRRSTQSVVITEEETPMREASF